jgi:hypothetical protein
MAMTAAMLMMPGNGKVDKPGDDGEGQAQRDEGQRAELAHDRGEVADREKRGFDDGGHHGQQDQDDDQHVAQNKIHNRIAGGRFCGSLHVRTLLNPRPCP